MLKTFFDSGAVVIVGLVLLLLEAVWLYARHRHDTIWHRMKWVLMAGAALLLALLAALRSWPWPLIAAGLTFSLLGHGLDLWRRLDTRGMRNRSR